MHHFEIRRQNNHKFFELKGFIGAAQNTAPRIGIRMVNNEPDVAMGLSTPRYRTAILGLGIRVVFKMCWWLPYHF